MISELLILPLAELEALDDLSITFDDSSQFSQFESHFLLDSQIDNASTGSRSQNIEIMLNSFESGLTIEHWVDN